MRRNFKKVLSVALSFILITVSAVATNSTTGADDIKISEMVTDAQYNVALNKSVTVYPQAVEGEPSMLVNGVLGEQNAAEHVSISKPGFNYAGESYATIDLGAVYSAATIDQIIVQYRYGTVNVGTATVVGKPYSVQYSVDGVDFNTITSTESAVLDSERMTYDDVSKTEGIVRYVRIYYPQTVQYSMQLLEIAVLDTDGDLEEFRGAEVADATDLVVEAVRDNTIHVQFFPSTTENVRYVIYVDGQVALENAAAGQINEITDLKVGNHTVSVKAIDNTGIASKGISQDIKVTGAAPAEEVIDDALYNLALNAPVTVQTLREGNASHITNGNIGTKTQTGDYGAVNTPGYVQIELAKVYKTEVIDEIDVWYRSSNPGLMPINVGYDIQFSSDGTEFITVKSVSAENMPPQPSDQNDIYTTKDNMKAVNAAALIDKVKYIRVVYNGNVAWGAQIREIAVFDMTGNAGNSGEEPSEEVTTEPETEKPTEEVTTEPVTTEKPVSGITLTEVIADSEWHDYAEYQYYVGAWNNSTAQMWMDPEDSDHIKVQQLTSNWWDAYALQIKKVYTGLTPGSKYIMSIDLTPSTPDGSYKKSDSEDTLALVAGTTKVSITATATDEGTAEFVLGFGWAGASTVIDLNNPVIEKAGCDITIDGTLIDTVEEGDVYILEGDAAYGYYADGAMYKSGAEVTITKDMAFTSVNELSVSMADGAGIRYAGTAGIRFQASVASDNMDAVASDAITEGTLITANDIYEAKGTPLTLTSDYTKIDVKNSGWFQNKVGTYCGSICDVVESNYIRNFTARAYVTVNYENGDAVTVYSSMGPVRSISQVAAAVKAAGYPGIAAENQSIIDSFIK